ncbi:hypothetical protein CONCODRAFT_71141 [Conidiobolus coronatus NRRL 28638]|uniref:Uncharacterized protein n=1 Tax=Conidiobolus coronatus (strain ATCC 28846 / CBS 209.66 / NRRL 28638) TaxID=796925 RepID=A0A137P4A2_CONC2|nr:hypothetical protein CONCODRAFT_71141 [Conidiobolus coronatus NRRL 28638]|eukprot:KXN69842.1 hypothetical protein CONCODRAFT_71141 [Conidiobolus coronatus NRRL 28638]
MIGFNKELEKATSNFSKIDVNRKNENVTDMVKSIEMQLDNFERESIIDTRCFMKCEKIKKEKEAIRIVYNEYYCDPAEELNNLYSDVYYDKSNNIVQKNPDQLSNIKWVIICRSKVDACGNRILFKLSKSAIDKLNEVKDKYNYNYTINSELFRQTRRDYDEALENDSQLSEPVGNAWERHNNLLPEITSELVYKSSYKLQQYRIHMPFAELINESEYDEYFS